MVRQVAQRDIEDITRWREDMNFMFEWQELYLSSERSERVSRSLLDSKPDY